MTYQPTLTYTQQLQQLQALEQQGYVLRYVPRRVLSFCWAIVMASRGGHTLEVELGRYLTVQQAEQVLYQAQQFVERDPIMARVSDALGGLDPEHILERSLPAELIELQWRCQQALSRLSRGDKHDVWVAVAGWLSLVQARLLTPGQCN